MNINVLNMGYTKTKNKTSWLQVNLPGQMVMYTMCASINMIKT